jgi:hypothetical protein
MDDKSLSALLKATVDTGDVTAPPETVSLVMGTIAVLDCLRALAELYIMAPLEIVGWTADGQN